MSLIQKAIAAQAGAVRKREVVYGTLMSFANSRPANVGGKPKEKIIVNLVVDGAPVQFYMFKDSVYGLPNFIPAGGLACQATLQEDTTDDGVEYINAVALGVDKA